MITIHQCTGPCGQGRGNCPHPNACAAPWTGRLLLVAAVLVSSAVLAAAVLWAAAGVPW